MQQQGKLKSTLLLWYPTYICVIAYGVFNDRTVIVTWWINHSDINVMCFAFMLSVCVHVNLICSEDIKHEVIGTSKMHLQVYTTFGYTKCFMGGKRTLKDLL